MKRVYEDDQLPYEANFFDIVINRHESYDLSELKRVLKPNGLIITQQVGGGNNDTGAIVYYAKIVPWEFPGFTVSNCMEKLLDIHSELQKHGYFECLQQRFIIVATNIK